MASPTRHALPPIRNTALPTAYAVFPIRYAEFPIGDMAFPIGDSALPTRHAVLPTGALVFPMRNAASPTRYAVPHMPTTELRIAIAKIRIREALYPNCPLAHDITQRVLAALAGNGLCSVTGDKKTTESGLSGAALDALIGPARTPFSRSRWRLRESRWALLQSRRTLVGSRRPFGRVRSNAWDEPS